MSNTEISFTYQKDTKGYTLDIKGARTSYCFVETPNGNKYQTELLIPINTPGVIDFATEMQKFAKAKFDKGYKLPIIKRGEDVIAKKLESGEEIEALEHYTDMAVISANTSTGYPPVKIGGPFYSGCYVAARIVVRPYTYDDEETKTTAKGIKGYLQAIKFIRNGDRLGGDFGSAPDWFTSISSEQSNGVIKDSPTVTYQQPGGSASVTQPKTKPAADDPFQDDIPF